MSALDLSTARWRKSTRSSNVANCVELATPGPVAIRDSKNPDGPALVFPESTLPSLLAHVR
ncbi:hypothetical protein UO65_5159 [Actinokineospora spheciospongiae]|uniref:DUF397 domain-containing protein n=1 Tax=Actinokineospora spheciospongiae TaxID=909613 RepID=W7IZS9_9PSEU|nr:DUF397 domain-containing protein [Actinokineospora spheciospongiae]EWC59554.1 hypothetical protein UO65_5159 [Actinokineospora spheciospongiae]